MNEIWEKVEGYERYSVSSYGRVKGSRGNILKPMKDKDGYLVVKISKGTIATYKTAKVHRLVAQAFLNLKSHFEVNHIDFNRSNNCVENLECVGHRENVKKSAHKGRYKTKNKVGENHGRAVLTENQVKEILAQPKRAKNGRGPGVGHAELAKKYGVSETRIWAIRAGKEWKHLQKT